MGIAEKVNGTVKQWKKNDKSRGRNGDTIIKCVMMMIVRKREWGEIYEYP